MANLEIQKWGLRRWRAKRAHKCWGCHAHFRSRWKSELNTSKQLLGLVKCLEISKELIRECVTMPGCCCCMPLLHNHLMDSCSYNYVRQNALLAAKGGYICTPLTPPESATALPSSFYMRHKSSCVPAAIQQVTKTV